MKFFVPIVTVGFAAALPRRRVAVAKPDEKRDAERDRERRLRGAPVCLRNTFLLLGS